MTANQNSQAVKSPSEIKKVKFRLSCYKLVILIITQKSWVTSVTKHMSNICSVVQAAAAGEAHPCQILIHLSISAPAIPFPAAAESAARPNSDALVLRCNQLELKCSHIHLHSRLVPKSSRRVLGRLWRLSAAKHTGAMAAVWPYCKIQAVFPFCVPKAEASWDLHEGLTLLHGRAYAREI